jgi:hypothetical protein
MLLQLEVASGVLRRSEYVNSSLCRVCRESYMHPMSTRCIVNISASRMQLASATEVEVHSWSRESLCRADWRYLKQREFSHDDLRRISPPQTTQAKTNMICNNLFSVPLRPMIMIPTGSPQLSTPVGIAHYSIMLAQPCGDMMGLTIGYPPL